MRGIARHEHRVVIIQVIDISRDDEGVAACGGGGGGVVEVVDAVGGGVWGGEVGVLCLCGEERGEMVCSERGRRGGVDGWWERRGRRGCGVKEEHTSL